MKRLRGFAIVSAIFILVVLAVLGAFILNISSSQQIGSAIDVQGARAYQAARAGIEWGMFRVQGTPAYNFSYGTPAATVGSADPDSRACPPPLPLPTSFQPAAPTLSGFVVTVRCARTPDGQGGPAIYDIVATACSQPNAGWTAISDACPNTTNPGNLYIERRLTATF